MATAMTITVTAANAAIPVDGGGTRNISWNGTTIPQGLYGLDEVVATAFHEYLNNGNTGSVSYTVDVSS